jgi:3-methyladenine DNA glycosylase AlkD
VKGAEFYGVAMPDTRRVGLNWWLSRDHDDPVGEAMTLGHHPITEIRLAGISIMEHVLIPNETMACDDLSRVRDAMDAGAFDDWNTCDWLCVKVLHQLMDRGQADTHMEMLSWSRADTVWVKRASLVSFVNQIPRAEPSKRFDGRFVTAAGRVVNDQRRFCQTSIGWTMRELSVRVPSIVEQFLFEHLPQLSREAINNATRKLDPPTRKALLSIHKSL